MARDYLNIGPVPCEEDCESLGPNYDPMKAKEECRRFAALIIEHCGEPPEGCSLRVKSFQHDFGTYYEVVAIYDDNDELAMDYAFHCEGDSPARWDGSGAKRWTQSTVEA